MPNLPNQDLLESQVHKVYFPYASNGDPLNGAIVNSIIDDLQTEKEKNMAKFTEIELVIQCFFFAIFLI